MVVCADQLLKSLARDVLSPLRELAGADDVHNRAPGERPSRLANLFMTVVVVVNCVRGYAAPSDPFVVRRAVDHDNRRLRAEGCRVLSPLGRRSRQTWGVRARLSRNAAWGEVRVTRPPAKARKFRVDMAR